MYPVRLKKKDKVMVLSGKDRGKRGEILRREGGEKYIVSKINIVTKHQRAKQNEQGGILKVEAPVHQSKLMLICPKCDSPTRPKTEILKDGGKVRTCRNCSEMIE
ncbi:MAG: 50S ribosomal protein L24 [Elusimicrobia bacterium RIFCSPLOWO2_01_FULL_64_13]|nr:MAG: 50S ribosomal protein L24 [Elusimicrobia bacterium RIFCSPHIGHO2_01_FULL_64_10]OGR95417.1 MAG: 50S ribosomal protein L24 [Elusimicrobia bacterium RIFCSPLOWO2_01_FULL_64_13]